MNELSLQGLLDLVGLITSEDLGGDELMGEYFMEMTPERVVHALAAAVGMMKPLIEVLEASFELEPGDFLRRSVAAAVGEPSS